MIKKRSRRISLLLVLMMLATMFVGVGTASAANYAALATPSVKASTTASLGKLIMNFDPIDTSASEALVKLPDSYVINTATITEITDDAFATPAVTEATAVIQASTNEVKVSIPAGAAIKQYQFALALNVNVPAGEAGDVVASIVPIKGSFSAGTVVLAKTSAGLVNVTVGTLENLGEAGGQIATLYLKEATTGSMAATDTITLKLPKGFTWSQVYNTGTAAWTNLTAAAGTTMQAEDIATSTGTTGTVYLGTDNTKLVITSLTASTAGKFMLELDTRINVGSDAKIGDIIVDVSSNGDVTTNVSEITVGTYSDYGVSVSAASKEDVKAGFYETEIGDIIIDEAAAGSLSLGKSIELKLPSYAKWANAAFAASNWALDDGTALAIGTTGAGTANYSDAQTLKIQITTQSTKAAKLRIKNLKVDLAIDAKAGDLAVTVKGSAGAAGEAIVGNVITPVTASATTTDINVGKQGQLVGEVTIKESAKDTIKDGAGANLTLSFVQQGAFFTSNPTVEVTEGNIDIDVDGITAKGLNTLTIPVKSASTKASTIKISNIAVTLDRSTPEGVVELEVGGTAVNEVNDNTLAAGTRAYPQFVAFADLFPQSDVAATVPVATVVTPAPGEIANVTVFTFGSTTYKVNGIDKAMDVAPYAKDNRTYMPIRYVAYALGIDDSNILWDGVNSTVTLMKGDKVVQLKIGSKTIMINGAAITMDVAPEAVSNRTMLPAALVAQAFGQTATYDAATQTVTIK